MSKAFKYNNNNYIDSSGIVHNRKLLSEILNNLIEIGSNSNGNYIKFSNGLLICYGRYSFAGTNSEYWSNFYRSENHIITFPQQFIDNRLTLNITSNSGTGAISVVYNYITNKEFEFCQIISKGVTSGKNTNEGGWIAIGQWK